MESDFSGEFGEDPIFFHFNSIFLPILWGQTLTNGLKPDSEITGSVDRRGLQLHTHADLLRIFGELSPLRVQQREESCFGDKRIQSSMFRQKKSVVNFKDSPVRIDSRGVFKVAEVVQL